MLNWLIASLRVLDRKKPLSNKHFFVKYRVRNPCHVHIIGKPIHRGTQLLAFQCYCLHRGHVTGNLNNLSKIGFSHTL